MQDPNLQIIEGTNPAKNLNRIQDMQKNIEAVRAEFIGKPEVCHFVVEIINKKNLIKLLEKLLELLNNYTDVILENYDVLRMLSAYTVVDIGDELQSAIAMNLSQWHKHTSPSSKCCHGNIDAIQGTNLKRH